MSRTVNIENAKFQTEKVDILDRTLEYALRIIRLYQSLEKDEVGRVLGKQLLRAGTSIGANLHEAQGAQTKADFIAKVSISQKECLESLYWLRLLKKGEVYLGRQIDELLDETEQLAKILSSIVVSSKRAS